MLLAGAAAIRSTGPKKSPAIHTIACTLPPKSPPRGKKGHRTAVPGQQQQQLSGRAPRGRCACDALSLLITWRAWYVAYSAPWRVRTCGWPRGVGAAAHPVGCVECRCCSTRILSRRLCAWAWGGGGGGGIYWDSFSLRFRFRFCCGLLHRWMGDWILRRLMVLIGVSVLCCRWGGDACMVLIDAYC